jgi:hypothetical protein
MARDQIHHDQTGKMTGQSAGAATCAPSISNVGGGTISEPTSTGPQGQQSRTRRQAGELASQATDSARRAGEHAKDAAQDVTRRVREQGTSLAMAQKERTAEELSHFGNAIRCAAETLHEEGDHNIADYADLAVERIDQMTRYIRERDLGGLVDDAEHATRRRPELVYGGMFIAGLALSRFLKASARNRRPEPQLDEFDSPANEFDRLPSPTGDIMASPTDEVMVGAC